MEPFTDVFAKTFSHPVECSTATAELVKCSISPMKSTRGGDSDGARTSHSKNTPFQSCWLTFLHCSGGVFVWPYLFVSCRCVTEAAATAKVWKSRRWQTVAAAANRRADSAGRLVHASVCQQQRVRLHCLSRVVWRDGTLQENIWSTERNQGQSRDWTQELHTENSFNKWVFVWWN